MGTTLYSAMCTPPPFLPVETHQHYLEIISIMGTTERRRILLVEFYSDQLHTPGKLPTSETHTLELLRNYMYTVSPFKSFSNHNFQWSPVFLTNRCKLLATCIPCLLGQQGATQKGLPNICSMVRCSTTEADIIWIC